MGRGRPVLRRPTDNKGERGLRPSRAGLMHWAWRSGAVRSIRQAVRSINRVPRLTTFARDPAVLAPLPPFPRYRRPVRFTSEPDVVAKAPRRRQVAAGVRGVRGGGRLTPSSLTQIATAARARPCAAHFATALGSRWSRVGRSVRMAAVAASRCHRPDTICPLREVNLIKSRRCGTAAAVQRPPCSLRAVL